MVELSIKDKKNILRKRARLLAKESMSNEQINDPIEILQFTIGNETYAVESQFVDEILTVNELVLIPCTPAFILGVINVRGILKTVIELKKIISSSSQEIVELNKVIIVHKNDIELGILVDSISGINNISKSDINPSSSLITDIKTEYMLGVTSDRLIVLDIQKILTDEYIIVNEEIDV